VATSHINLVKLCVGVNTLDDLIAWRSRWRADNPGEPMRHVTRMWPRRAAELLDGGSLYWVIKGVILARQRVLRLDETRGEDGIRRCAIMLDSTVIRTESVPRRPFQGWRYLDPGNSPRDLHQARPQETRLPPGLSAALADIGVR